MTRRQQLLVAGGTLVAVAVLLHAKPAHARAKEEEPPPPRGSDGDDLLPAPGTRGVDRWRPLASFYADQQGVPVAWVLAIIKNESGGDENARATDPRDLARGGSFGLMQMSFKTAQGLGYGGEPAGLLDPHTNVALGASLLKQLRRQCGDDFRSIAAAYNSGRCYDRAPDMSKAYAERAVQNTDQFAGVMLAGVGYAAVRAMNWRRAA